MSKTNKVTLESIITERYGIAPDQADALVIEWAAEHMAGIVGAEAAVKAWRRMNSRRECMGRYTTYPAYGSTLWAAAKATA